ncbi:MAG TPA: HAMP domain-containing sensor histidine kinase, partial [Candidatus Kapabacteria bacterium]|nr:HAMP domain-containing sensor histidine kinase [Candidatus Kapabacteria bacterium]
LNFETNPIKDLIEDVVSKNQVMARKKNIKLFTELPTNLPEVEMDYRRISEALENLISNAIKFTEENGTVRVRAFKEGGNITVEVSDNGLGLSEEDVEKAFRWGQKLSSQPTGGEPSSGLGLWIVKKIIDSHNGRVWIKSALGKGSTFAFSFPIKREE